jgi:hypothetical protein
MKENAIPQFVELLKRKYEDKNEAQWRLLTSERFILELHQAGINIRHLLFQLVLVNVLLGKRSFLL